MTVIFLLRFIIDLSCEILALYWLLMVLMGGMINASHLASSPPKLSWSNIFLTIAACFHLLNFSRFNFYELFLEEVYRMDDLAQYFTYYITALILAIGILSIYLFFARTFAEEKEASSIWLRRSPKLLALFNIVLILTNLMSYFALKTLLSLAT